MTAFDAHIEVPGLDLLLATIDELRTEVHALRAERAVERGALSIAEAADWLGVSEPTVRGLIRDGHLDARRVGTRVLISITALRRFVDPAAASSASSTATPTGGDGAFDGSAGPASQGSPDSHFHRDGPPTR